MSLALYGRGEVLRPEIEVSDRPEARQISGFGWRDHDKFNKSRYYRKPKISIIANPNIFFQKSSRQISWGQNVDLGLYFHAAGLFS